MPLSLREARLEDVEQICDAYLSAFSEDTITQQTLPLDSGSGRAFWREHITNEISGSKTDVLVVTDDADAGKVIAFAKWKRPGSVIEDPPPAHLWPQDGNQELGPRFFGRFSQNHREIMGDRRHWFLELVATDKRASGRGAARKLLEWGLEQADRDGLPTYLEATLEAEPIYVNKFGFREVRREKIDAVTQVIDVPFLIREPKTGS